MNKITDTEDLFCSQWFQMPGWTYPQDLNQRTLDIARRRLREIAYHEAGHIAARAFTGLDYSHILWVSVIPDEDEGCGWGVLSRGYNAEWDFADSTPLGLGYQVLLRLLAGSVAGIRGTVDPEYREELQDDWNYWEWESDEEDFPRAEEISHMLARRHHPAHHIIRQAKQWTEEMLDRPDVWQCVKTLAGMLLREGTLSAREIYPAMDRVVGIHGLKGVDRRKWLRRFAQK